ncbi:MAG TPA: acylphosphatase [Candidatus Competibacteraceae bacterium]|mgnify:CR=1 FL=1|nr:acylphosphatase [Candidatus Competibacteraceae bacterium]HQA26482.1 acylphosphatase [Candidatus Competibacteraceae bacterium]HQD57415.1 acylphosphatase [Candidatus Competibacteraceae bacterium]
MKTCLHCYVSGRVQGVGFRYATADKAWGLSITGYVRNLPDRQVEVLACGEERAVNALRHWLWQGPPHAQVTAVHCEILPFQDFPDFRID